VAQLVRGDVQRGAGAVGQPGRGDGGVEAAADPGGAHTGSGWPVMAGCGPAGVNRLVDVRHQGCTNGLAEQPLGGSFKQPGEHPCVY
jgi:hypothetical protein